ncbi:transmembrane protein, putative (macronuclear) [Tetrahymena thermophila SB210]|uniref:Transmembrane protein, putative n=1 Tax=Tetrahymena thermophila (strain SB210) TaxID=312017 RepID=Q22BJ0_TETTS|nr:transmembrane protein, putative [Tetrahymena thermophila SB210]EAR82676.2 transmembrane protein, putative [Tetrahymena thermophila SB210]|eukprot:XP_001030339.2 transmembrane protein, putative [Tetrahymena thermophila SB210]
MKSRLKFQKLIYISFILLAVLAQSTLCGEPFDTDEKVHQILELNKEKQYFFNGTRFNQTIYLKYTFEGDFDIENDLLLIARPNDFKSDPDVFVSRTIQFPTPDNADYRCWHSGLEICYIAPNWLQGAKEIYITLFSYQPHCNFTFEARLQHRTEQIIQWNQDTVLFLGAPGETHQQSQQVVKIYVPPDESIEHFTFSAIVDPVSRQNLTEAIKLYVMFGNETPSNSRSLWGIYSSSYGETFTSFKYQPTFRTGINYTMLIIGQTNTTVNLLCRKDTNEPVKLKFNLNSDKQKTLYDAIPVGRYLIYELDTGVMHRDANTNKIDQTLLINLLVQQGNPDMYIDCDQPLSLNSLDQAKWVSDSNGEESLIISAQEFQKYQKQCNKLYILVYARVCAAFALEFSIRDQFRDEDIILSIYPSISENGYIEDNQIVNYLLQMDKYTQETVQVSLFAKNGNPDLYIKKCKDTKSCRATRKELENINQDNKSDFIGLSKELGNDFITFQHSVANCENSNSIYCQYLITVFSNPALQNNSPTQEIHYSLLVQYQSKSVQLLENNPLYQQIGLEQFNYYSYSLVSLEGIKKVYFQVTPISGIMELLVSRYHTKPNFRETERIACFCSNVISYSVEELLQQNQQSINFYMSVYGFSNSIYTISVYIERFQKDENGNNDPNSSLISMVLKNDIPQKYVFDPTNSYVYFDIFETDSDPVVSINPLKGEFHIDAWPLLSSNQQNYTLPDDNSGETVYKTQYNSLILHVKNVQQKSQFKGFRVRIQKLTNRDQAQFTIEYSNQSQITTLYENYPIQTYIKPDETKFFKFAVTYDDYVVAVAYTSAHTGLFMEISGDKVHQNDSSVTYQTNSMSESSIQIFYPFNQECTQKVEQNNECFLYGSIQMSEQAQQKYTQEMYSLPTEIYLIRFNKQLKTQNLNLKDGSINYYPLPVDETKDTEFYTFNFYVNPNNFDQDIQVITTLEHGNLNVKYVILDTSNPNMSKPSSWQKSFPTLSEVEQRSLIDNSDNEIREKQSSMINISSAEFICKPKCVVLITAFAKNVKKIKQNSQLVIQVVSDIIDLTHLESSEIASFVSHNQYKYFKIYLPQDFAVITFNAVAIQSMFDINLVSYYSKNYSSFRPTETNCNQCQSSNLEPGRFDQIEYIPAKGGYYIVGVYGSEGYKARFKFIWNTNQIQQVQFRETYSVQITSQKSFVFHADRYRNSGFDLSISVQDQFKNDITNDGVLSMAIYHCNSDYLRGCIVENPNLKRIESKSQKYQYQDICGDKVVCTVVLTFKSNNDRYISFDFLLNEILQESFDFDNQNISIISDQTIIYPIMKNKKQRFQISLPYIVSDDFQLSNNFILRVQQYSGSVDISLWPKDQNIYEIQNSILNFKWIEIKPETLKNKNFVYLDVFNCNQESCYIYIALYVANTPKDISQLQSVAEILNYNSNIIITGSNMTFKDSRLIIYIQDISKQLEDAQILVSKEDKSLQTIQIQKHKYYYEIDQIYEPNLDSQKVSNIFIKLNRTDDRIENLQVAVAIYLMKYHGSQIPLLATPQNEIEYYQSFIPNRFYENQEFATHILDVPNQAKEKSYLLIDLTSCDNGDIRLKGSQSLENFEQGKYDLEIKQQSKQKSQFTIQLKDNQKIYLKLSRPQNQLNKQLRYLILSYIISNSNSPSFKVQSITGLVEMQRIQNQIYVYWDMLTGSIHFDDTNKVIKNTQFYLVILKKRAFELVQPNMNCIFSQQYAKNENSVHFYLKLNQDQVKIDEEKKLFYYELDAKNFKNQFQKFEEQQDFYSTIKAQINPNIYGNIDKNSVWYNEVDYQITNIDKNFFVDDISMPPQSSDTDESLQHTIIILTIVIGISMILLGIYLYRRYNLTKKRIQFEVSYREQQDIQENVEQSNP